MVLFAEYFAEHSIHTLKLSTANFQQGADFSELTNLLKPFGSINVRKLEIKVGIPFIPANLHKFKFTLLDRDTSEMHGFWQFWKRFGMPIWNIWKFARYFHPALCEFIDLTIKLSPVRHFKRRIGRSWQVPQQQPKIAKACRSSILGHQNTSCFHDLTKFAGQWVLQCWPGDGRSIEGKYASRTSGYIGLICSLYHNTSC